MAGGAGGPGMGMGDRAVGDAPEGLGEKWVRQLGSVWKLPGYAISFLLRFSDSLSLFPPSASSTFQQSALNKLALVASSSGKVYALETSPSAQGGVLCSRILGVSGAPHGVGRVDVQRVLAVQAVAWVVLGQRWDEHSFKTAVWSIDPLTGTIHPPPGREGTTPGLTLFDGPMEAANHNETVVIVSQSGEVHLFPEKDSRSASLVKRDGLYFSLPLRTGDVSLDQAALQGFTLIPTPGGMSSIPTFRTYLTPSPKSELLELIRPPLGPVASLGRVLGSKQTLYKYLNPHLILALTQYPTPAGETRCGIHLVDQCDIRPVMVENWLVWQFWNDGDSGVSQGEQGGMRTKGWRVVVVELYEGEPDELTRSAQLSSFASNASRVHAFPYALLDPRRPTGKLTSSQKEKLLIPFNSVITDDPRRTVSQNLHIMGISSLSTIPTALESTSLLLASCLDVFLARLAPSSGFDILGENFNKTQLILTVLGLLVAIGIVRPIVESEKVRQRWYATN
ncbi:DUF1620-domain-containing protein [Dacryopinax primogenitus]|uniref:ER membrane protein complex subunit 1 n=1 Tax=Dacryopinax primogenitus (strain DJM 731) TaxID=1858805 RepID=M5G027_DACPD|nr:DUF1620-domain-containing protein [Dacryopinax primogenitus]EJT97127.1 DUF1620-domain-containing protein [Dacryopinax primogenitus]